MTKRFRLHIKTLQSLQFGPLGSHLENFALLLIQRRYSSEAGWDKIRLVADLSRWMVEKKVRLEELDENLTKAFFRWRWQRVAYQTGDKCTLALLLRQLRQRGVVPTPTTAAPNCVDLIERDYEHFLRHERGLMSSTVPGYLVVVRRFLCHCFQGGEIQLQELCTKDVTDFVVEDAPIRGRKAAQLMASAMRSFLNYLFQGGRTSTNLAMAVPAVAGGRLSELPRYLETAQVEKLLRCCDRRRRVGRRDYAILLLLARLGLRGGEVVGLELEDLDWPAGEMLIRGKANRVDRLPLLEDVGKALADYLRKGRPSCSSRRVFVQCNAPFAGFSSPPNAVSGIVSRALARAGIQSRHRGAHLLRHSLATSMLRRGASLAQIGQVLRHESPQTTEIYAKVDLKALRALAQPWPGGAQ